MKKLFLLFLLNILVPGLRANIILPALVGDNMVLQRDTKINLWGWADPGEKISIQFQARQLKTKAGKDGKWTIILPSFPAGGPYQMFIKGKNSITLQNILIGDVWLASGQSNMEMRLHDIKNGEQETESADYPQIRLFTVTKKFAFQPREKLSSGYWTVCSPDAVASFSAVEYLFGREIYKRYKIPVGLIHSSWGGTAAQAWISSEGLKPFPAYSKTAKDLSCIDSITYDAYIAKRKAWLREFAKTDRGRVPGSTSWDATELNTADWLTMKLPGFWSSYKELKGYSGTIWFRKSIEVPEQAAGKSIELHLGSILFRDSIFVNGQLIGATTGQEKKRVYQVPGNLVKAGSNLLVLRITGILDFGGMTGTSNELYARVAEKKISLAGDWLYKTAPDIGSFPHDERLSGFLPGSPQTPSVIFNAMIAPLIPYSIKGVIWYQGESNTNSMDEAKEYASLFPALIGDWRHKWGYDFPFLFVQLAGYKSDEDQPGDYIWAHLREAQYKTLTVPNTAMATAIDIGEEDDIHPKNKQDVAKRLVLAAEKIVYNENVVFSGPTYKSMKIETDRIRIAFDNIGSGLWLKDKYGYILGFAIAGADKKFVWAKAYQDGNEIIIYADGLKQPVAVRYNWGNKPEGNLYNKENLPAVPFRTDGW